MSHATSDDDELLDWIDECTEDELRQVLKYLILLNADAVQKAMKYVQRGRRRTRSSDSLSNSVIVGGGSGGGVNGNNIQNDYNSSSNNNNNNNDNMVSDYYPSDRSPHRRSLSQESDDITMDSIFVSNSHHLEGGGGGGGGSYNNESGGAHDPTTSASASTSPNKPNQKYEQQQQQQQQQRHLPPMSPAPVAMVSQLPTPVTSPSPGAAYSSSQHSTTSSRRRKRSSNKGKPARKLLVLCTSKPTSRKQGEDQDKAMKLCKQAGVAPYIVLKESKPLDAQELIKISKVSEYPQFFLRSNIDQEDENATTFWGDYDTVNQLHVQGLFTPDILKAPQPLPPSLPATTTTPPQGTTASNNNRRFDTLFQKSAYEESSDDSTTMHNALGQRGGDSYDSIPDHLKGMNQPARVDATHDDAKSIDSLGDLFDPPSPPPPEKPLLTAAQKAAEQRKKREDIARGIPEHLAGLHTPQHSMEDDTMSLGGDPRMIFDPPKPPPAEKPLLEAAKRAAAAHPPSPTPKQLKKQQDMAKGIPEHLAGLNTPQHSMDDDDDTMSLGGDPRMIFDPPKPPPAEKPLLEAAKRAAAAQSLTPAAKQQKKVQDMAKGIPEHLAGLHTPQQSMDDDTMSLGGDPRMIFDPPRPPPGEKPLLEAAKRAAAAHSRSPMGKQQKKQQDIAKGVPEHLAGLNTPQHSMDDDTMSLGGDPRTIFDPPKPPLGEKPLLEAAQRAAAQQRQQKEPQAPLQVSMSPLPSKSSNTPPAAVSTSEVSFVSSPPSPSLVSPHQRRAGFSSETITLKPVGSRRPSGRMGESGSDPADDQPPPSPSASKAKLSLSSSSKAGMPTSSLRSSPPNKLPPPRIIEAAPAPAPVVAPTTSGSDQPAWMKVLAEQEHAEESGNTNSSVTPTWMANASTTTTTTTTIISMISSPEPPRKPKIPEGGACYLVYDAVKAELNIYYSEIPIIGAVGVWTSPDIEAFKEAQGLGKSELIGVCASGVQDRQLYYDGWCQFVKAAKSMDATVIVLEVGVPVDFYLYTNGETQRVQSGVFETSSVDAVACLPRNASFPMDLKGKKWSKAAKKIGAVALFKSLSSKDGTASTVTAISETRPQLQGATPTIPEDEEVVLEAIVPGPTPTARPPGKATQAPSPIPPTVVEQAPTPIPATAAEWTDGYPSSLEAPNPSNGACYLVYEPDSSGRLVEHYSKTPIPEAIGRWVPSGSKTIAGFKFKQNLGKTILIGNCSAGVQGRKNYSSGWCQFVRSARVMEANVMLWDPVAKGLMVDVFLYMDDNRPTHQTVKLQPGVEVNVEKTLAVACIPKNTPFYEGMGVDILKWLADGSNYGASSRF